MQEEIRDFTNALACELKPSNDTMEAVRLVRSRLPDFMYKAFQAQKREIVELAGSQKEVYQAHHEIPEGCEVGDEKLHMDSCCNEIIDDIICLINNK